MNFLFVCSKNKWRSRTAETIFGKSTLHRIKSAGTDAEAKVVVTDSILRWADLVFVMEEKHKKMILEKFSDLPLSGKILCSIFRINTSLWMRN